MRFAAERELVRLHPAGRIGTAQDVANTVVWLASDAARFITGQLITMDGGRTAKASLPAIMDVRT
jgi:meso-butanediol dehydrogenase/(S,S)-butanediol dehydrogenase/diacetyl reductase